MPYILPASGFSQQTDEVVKQLSYLTDEAVEVGDDEGDPIRNISFLVAVPDPAVGATTTFDYREEFRRVTGGWMRTRYVYELRVSDPWSDDLNRRRAHHEHDPWKIHQHCHRKSEPDVHYADVERLLQAVHQDFVKLYAAGSPINCAGLVSLE